MEQKEIIEGNKMIAEFMGAKYQPKVNQFNPENVMNVYVFSGLPDRYPEDDGTKYHKLDYELLYHRWWDWLMPVVEKIEALGFQFFIHNEGSYIKKWFYRGNVPDIGNVGTSKIEGVYKTVLSFLHFYNNQKSNT